MWVKCKGSVGIYMRAIPNLLFPFITFKSCWTSQQSTIFWCESTVAALLRGSAESVDILRYISHWAEIGCEIATRKNTCMRERHRDGERQNKQGVKCLTYLVAPLAMAAEQREMCPGGTVLWSVVVQTLWLDPWATHLRGGDKDNK